jgi:hypothetical protein
MTNLISGFLRGGRRFGGGLDESRVLPEQQRNEKESEKESGEYRNEDDDDDRYEQSPAEELHGRDHEVLENRRQKEREQQYDRNQPRDVSDSHFPPPVPHSGKDTITGNGNSFNWPGIRVKSVTRSGGKFSSFQGEIHLFGNADPGFVLEHVYKITHFVNIGRGDQENQPRFDLGWFSFIL